MDLTVVGRERMDCGIGWTEVQAVVNMINVWVPQNSGRFSRSPITNTFLSKESAPWMWLGLD